MSNTGLSEWAANVDLGQKNISWGWQAKYKLFQTEIAILRESHLGNVQQILTSERPSIVLPFSYEIDKPSQKITHHLAKGVLYKRFEGVGKLNFQYDYQRNRRFEFDRNRSSTNDTPAVDLTLTTHAILADFHHDANSEFKWNTGISGRYQDNFASPDITVRRLIPDFEKYDFGIYGNFQTNINTDLFWDAGLRYDFSQIDALKFYRTSRWAERGYDQDFSDIIINQQGSQFLTNPVFDYHTWAFSTGLKWTKELSEWSVNYTFNQRPPNPAELFSDGLHQAVARIELGDIRIGKESSHKIIGHWGYAKASSRFDIEGFYQQVSNYIQLVPTGIQLSIRGQFLAWEYAATDAYLTGFTAQFQQQYSPKWSSTHAVNYMYGQDTSSDIPLINIPAPSLKQTINFKQPKFKNLSASLESVLFLKQTRTPYNITFAGEPLNVNDAPDGYHLINSNINMTWPLGDCFIDTKLTVENIFNQRYRDYLDTQRFFADAPGTNIILTLNLNF